jgi:hypothetical protein
MLVQLEEEGRLERKSNRQKRNNGERMVYKEWPRIHRTSTPNSPCGETHVHAVYHGTCCDTTPSGFTVYYCTRRAHTDPRAKLGSGTMISRPPAKKRTNLLRCSVPALADMDNFTRIFVYLRSPG